MHSAIDMTYSINMTNTIYKKLEIIDDTLFNVMLHLTTFGLLLGYLWIALNDLDIFLNTLPFEDSRRIIIALMTNTLESI